MVSRDGKLFAFAARNTVVVLDLTSHQLMHLLHGHVKRLAPGFDNPRYNCMCHRVMCVVFCEDGLLCSAGQDRSIRVWDVSNGSCVKTLYKQAADMTVMDAFSQSVQG